MRIQATLRLTFLALLLVVPVPNGPAKASLLTSRLAWAKLSGRECRRWMRTAMRGLVCVSLRSRFL